MLKLAGGLYVLSLLGKLFGTTGILFIAFVAAFNLPTLYAKKQREIENTLAICKEKAGVAAHAAKLQLSGLLSKLKKS